MDDRIRVFIHELKSGLAGLPESEAREAAEYYEEYINDALDEGESVESILTRLGPSENIAAVTMAETSIRKAQINPGLKNYTRALKYSRTLITKPFSIMLFSIFVIVTYSMAFLLFLSSIVSAAAACVILPGFLYEATKIPSKYMAEIVGTVGMGLFSAAICLLLAYGLVKLCGIFIRLSSGLIGRILDQAGKQRYKAGEGTNYTDIGILANEHDDSSANKQDDKSRNEHPAKRARSSKWIPAACLVAIVAGLVLSLASGLPVKLFMIFNSMEPTSVTTQEWEYNKEAVGKINITTANSHIRLVNSGSDKIKISYEQPDWMEPEISCTNGQLTFTEKSNGRLPLFSMISIHENSTNVILALPEGFDPSSLILESRGGFIYILTGEFNTVVKTYTGGIFIEPGVARTAGISAVTSTGTIQTGGTDVGLKSANGLKYESTGNGGKNIDIETSRGSIFIN